MSLCSGTPLVACLPMQRGMQSCGCLGQDNNIHEQHRHESCSMQCGYLNRALLHVSLQKKLCAVPDRAVAVPEQELGFGIVATGGTAAHLEAAGVASKRVLKIQEGRPNASDLMKNGEIAMMLITSTGDEVGAWPGSSHAVLQLACSSAVMHPERHEREGSWS